jgi:quinolinate synthase
VATEAGIIHQMRRARPDAEFIPAEPNSGCDCAICPYMRLNTLEKVRSCMEQMSPAIEIDEAIAVPARRAVERMLEMSEDLPAR